MPSAGTCPYSPVIISASALYSSLLPIFFIFASIAQLTAYLILWLLCGYTGGALVWFDFSRVIYFSSL